MIIYIKQFGNYEEAEFKFTNGSVVLIKGSGGVGKTTILRAIRWTLYGGPLEGAASASVTIKYGTLTISREAPPDSLTVTRTDSGMSVTGQPAMTIITDTFGSADIFDLCCYVKAGTMKSPITLFDVSPEKRLAALTALAFRNEEDPMAIVEKIRVYMKKLKRDAKDAKVIHMRTAEELDIRRQSAEVIAANIDTILITETLESLDATYATTLKAYEERSRFCGEVQTLQKQFVITQSTLAANEKTLGTLIIQYNQATTQLQKLVISDPKIIRDTATAKLAATTAIAVAEKRLHVLAQCIASHTALSTIMIICAPILEEIHARRIAIPATITREHVREIHTVNEGRRKTQELCAAYDCAYDTIAIASAIAKYQRIVSYRINKIAYEAYNAAKIHYHSLQRCDTLALEMTLRATREGSQLEKCPSCSAMLCRNATGLAVAKTAFATKADVTRDDNAVRDGKKQNDLHDRARHHVETLSTPGALSFVLTPTLDTKIDVNAAITVLSGARVVPPTQYTDDEADLLYKLFSLGWKPTIGISNDVDTLSSAKNESETLQQHLKNLKSQYAILDKRLTDAYQGKTQYDACNHNAKLIKQRRETLEAVVIKTREESQNAHSRILELNTTIASSNASESHLDILRERRKNIMVRDAIVSDQLRVNMLKEIVEKAAKNFLIISEILHNAVDEHYKRLNDLVTILNINISAMIPRLFSYPLSVRLSLYVVRAKASKIPKHSVSLEIIRRGALAPSLDSDAVAESEKQRIVFLTILSIGIHTGWTTTPLLLLDEPMSRLDHNQRCDALELLRETNYRRTVIITEHHTDDDNYDEVIALGE